MRCPPLLFVLLLSLPPLSGAEDNLAELSVDERPAASAAMEDAASDSRITRLEPITVTATKTPRRIGDVAESLSQIDRASLQDFAASDLAEALAQVPGADIAGGPRPGGEAVVLRGLSGTRVLMAVDGARQNFDGGHRTRLNLDPELLKSVDILRGPASAIWGSDALGGVISLTTKDAADFLEPGEQLGGRLRWRSESADRQRSGGGSAFGRFGKLDVLADFNRSSQQDLEQADGQRLPFSALDAESGLYKITQFFSDANELALSLQTYRTQGVSPSNPTQDLSDTNPLLDRENDQRYLTGRYSFQSPDADALFAGANLTLYRSTLDTVEDRVDEPRFDTLAFETTGGSVQTTLHLPALASRLTLGGESYVDSGAATRDGAPRPQFPDAERRVSGVFVQDEIEWGNWSLTPGIRHDRFHSRSNTGAGESIEETAVSPKLGLSYAATHWLTLTGLYAEAFRAPSLLESYAQGTHFLGNEFRPNPDLVPEKADNRELGLRLRFLDLLGRDDRLSVRMNIFDNDVRDFIETVVVVEEQGPFPPALQCAPPFPAVGCVNRNDDGTANPAVPVLIFIGGYTTSENLTRARIRGGELEAAYDIGAFTLKLGYSRTQGRNDDNGQPLLNIPAHRLSFGTGWQSGPWRAGARVQRVDAQNSVPVLDDGTPVIPGTPGYTVADVYASWSAQRWAPGLRLDLGVDNLGNRLYRRHLSNFNEAGRSLRAGLSYQF